MNLNKRVIKPQMQKQNIINIQKAFSCLLPVTSSPTPKAAISSNHSAYFGTLL